MKISAKEKRETRESRRYWNLRCIKCEATHREEPIARISFRFGGSTGITAYICASCLLGEMAKDHPVLKAFVNREPLESRKPREKLKPKPRKKRILGKNRNKDSIGDEQVIADDDSVEIEKRVVSVEGPSEDPPEDSIHVYTIARGMKVSKEHLLEVIRENQIKMDGESPNEFVKRKFVDDIRDLVVLHKDANPRKSLPGAEGRTEGEERDGERDGEGEDGEGQD